MREPDPIAIRNLLPGGFLTAISLVLKTVAAYTLESVAAFRWIG